MIHFKTNKGTFAAVPLPEDAYKIKISGSGWLCYKDNPNSRWWIVYPDFDFTGNTLIGQVKDLTEEQWREVVDTVGENYFMNYNLGGDFNHASMLHTYNKVTATASGLSLCTAHGIQQHDVVVRVG